MKKTNFLLGTLTVVAAAVLTACGGGSSAVKVSGVAMDGYLENAKVCLDIDGDGQCGASEPSATTNAKGEFSIDASADQKEKYHVVVQAIAGTTKDSDDGGSALTQSYTITAPVGKTDVISPLTTLVVAKMKAGANLADAEAAVRTDLGLVANAGLYQDVTTDTALHAAARAVTELGLKPQKKLNELITTESLGGMKTQAGQIQAVFEAEKQAVTAANAARASATQAGKKFVSLDFAAFAGNTRITCGSSLTGLGTTSAAGGLQDLRFYISNVKLVKADKSTVPLTLSQSDNFNTTVGENSVSLIDLENKTGLCAGTTEMNTAIQGTVPAGDYVGMQMTLGVPLALNHTNQAADVSVTPAVINNAVHPGMAWAWAGGRKFTKIEVTNSTWTAPSFYVHLGSTGCTGDNPSAGVVSSCARPNRVDLSFSSFNPETQKIAVDVKGLLSGNDVTVNGGGPGGCMSGATDPECAAIFPALGLDLTAGTLVNNGADQRLFKVISK